MFMAGRVCIAAARLQQGCSKESGKAMTYYYCDKPGTNCGAVVVAKGGSTSKLPAGARQKDRHSVMRLGRKIVPIKTDDLEKRELFEEIGRAKPL
jgi:hypothetical protein